MIITKLNQCQGNQTISKEIINPEDVAFVSGAALFTQSLLIAVTSALGDESNTFPKALASEFVDNLPLMAGMTGFGFALPYALDYVFGDAS